ncbi:protein kinase domain-containing protein [Legionella shakespearei]|uniref:Serine/threonine-protein kinase PknB n=1 Tax=Legionella shakespearei DSM 23087 TaxID=1122169 RepID=A0A0W0Z0M8_9GAMM|nr:protein kinase [Legionella shakespearei]KTD62684.1 Serine/threonine-protein kinase PknB [Legionella shakespearei DSM 23087]
MHAEVKSVKSLEMRKEQWLQSIKSSDLKSQFAFFIEKEKEFRRVLCLDGSVLPVMGTKTDGAYNIFIIGPRIGKGAEGAVYFAYDLLQDKVLVVKEIIPNGQPEEYVTPEKNALQAVDRLFGHYIANPSRDQYHREYLFMPFYPGGNCIDLMYELNHEFDKEDFRRYTAKKQLPMELILDSAEAALLELKLLGERGVIHRDINPFNIICSTKETESGIALNELHVIDFGTALLVNKSRTHAITGTFGYTPPEIDVCESKNEQSKHKKKTKKRTYDFSSDLFSLGVFLAELITTANYQEYRIKKMAEIAKKEGFSRPLTLQEIKEGMPDIFAATTEETSTKKQAFIHLVHTLMDEDPEKRRTVKAGIHSINGIRNGHGLLKRTSKRFLDLTFHGAQSVPSLPSPRSPRPSTSDALIQQITPPLVRRNTLTGSDIKVEDKPVSTSPLAGRHSRLDLSRSANSLNLRNLLGATSTDNHVNFEPENSSGTRTLRRQASAVLSTTAGENFPQNSEQDIIELPDNGLSL